MGIRAALGGWSRSKIRVPEHPGSFKGQDNPAFCDSTGMDACIIFSHSSLPAEVILPKKAGGTHVIEKQFMTPAMQRPVCRPGYAACEARLCKVLITGITLIGPHMCPK